MQQSYMLQLPVSSHDAGLEWEFPHQQGVTQVCVVTTEPCWTAVNPPHKPSALLKDQSHWHALHLHQFSHKPTPFVKHPSLW